MIGNEHRYPLILWYGGGGGGSDARLLFYHMTNTLGMLRHCAILRFQYEILNVSNSA